ncbi:hypothetical protein IC615_13525 [Serratia ureilytica]
MEALSPKQKGNTAIAARSAANIIRAIARQCPVAGPPPQQQWLSTRQLANAVNVGVYRARRLLLILSPDKK